MTGRLLVVDDDPIGCRVVMRIMEHEGFETMAAHDGEACLTRAAADHPDLVILDLELPKLDGIQVLERLKAAQPNLPVIMLTGHYDVKATVRAMRLGAFDYLTKPVNSEELTIVVRRALQVHALESEVEDLRRRAGGADSLDAQMGPSLAVRQITEQVKTVAATNFSVMVLGETGTGKELVAHALHRQSERRAQPFVALDCGAIPEPLLESELFGHEKGAFTGRRPAQGGPLPPRRQRHLVSRRDRQPAAQPAGRSCCACWSRGSCRPSAPADRPRSMCVSSPPPTTTCRNASPRDVSAPTCIFASRSTRSPCRRCATAPKTSRTWRAASCARSASSCGGRCRGSPRKALALLRRHGGPGTCASCAT